MGKKIIGYCYKKGLGAAKTVSKNVIQKPAETTVELTGNKIAGKILRLKSVPDENLTNVEEIVIPSEKRQEILNRLRQVI